MQTVTNRPTVRPLGTVLRNYERGLKMDAQTHGPARELHALLLLLTGSQGTSELEPEQVDTLLVLACRLAGQCLAPETGA